MHYAHRGGQLLLRFGLFTGTTGISWPQLQALWQHIEATGWDVAFVTDHFMPNTRDPIDDTLECWTALSGLALSTQRLRLGTLVVGNTYERERLVRGLMQRFGRSEAEARDTVLAGSVAYLQDTLGRMQDAGVQQVYVPTFLPAWNLE